MGQHALCKRGHELAGDNVYIYPKTGQRACRRCRGANSATTRNEARGRHPRETLLRVPNAPLRERYLELERLGRASSSTIALAMEWTYGERHGKPRPDTTRLLRVLGIKPAESGGEMVYRQAIDYDTAVQLSRLLGMEPYEAGV